MIKILNRCFYLFFINLSTALFHAIQEACYMMLVLNSIGSPSTIPPSSWPYLEKGLLIYLEPTEQRVSVLLLLRRKTMLNKHRNKFQGELVIRLLTYMLLSVYCSFLPDMLEHYRRPSFFKRFSSSAIAFAGMTQIKIRSIKIPN